MRIHRVRDDVIIGLLKTSQTVFCFFVFIFHLVNNIKVWSCHLFLLLKLSSYCGFVLLLLQLLIVLRLPCFGRYCLADDRLLDAVKFLDLGDGAGWELLQVLLY